MSPPSTGDATTSADMESSAAHDAITLALAKKESAEHLHGMPELYEEMRRRPLLVKAFKVDDPKAPPDDGENVKTVHFLRHGQGFHNLMADLAKAEGRDWVQYTHTPENPYIMPEILDAPLTQKGRNQARLIQPRIATLPNKPELVVLSPNCRAIQTGLIAFQELLPPTNSNVPFLAHEMVREENGVHTCDKRRPTSQAAAEFPQVDFSLIETEEDVIFRNDRRETKMEIGERIYKFMEWLADRPERHVAVSSHSGWLMTVFNGILECEESLKPWFQTGEMRSVKLVFTKQEE
eukprot:CAMPEP_0185735678 /NCGR_PEP_ID=MMETSP1171-20130828/25922_1 /TAXON_ID=374046 /ORGANISM="Helicotheca tamensis, Strain CCMP826" /LENGTH=292 /DNA_ID=CAMNT_0028406065 /DNA_START=161 /DNA_END=1039 /DNA_ORIENTATION=-